MGLALKEITDAKGCVTTFEYESSECNSFRHSVGIGLRIKNITVRDPLTGRHKNRHFTYEHPVSTINFDLLEPKHFIAEGGLIRYYIPAKKEYSSGATFTASCRIPGAPVENATIYYGKVTEDITGTGIDRPIRLAYEFDTLNVDQPYIINGHDFLPISNNERYKGTKIYCPNNGSWTEYSTVFGPQRIYAHFQETCWEKAPMIHKTVYRYANGGYEPLLEEWNNYSLDREETINVGFFVECTTRKVDQSISGAGYNKEIIEKLSDLNFLETTLATGRLYKDSTTTIRHFPDGSMQKTTVSYRYESHRKPSPDILPNNRVRTVRLDSVKWADKPIIPGTLRYPEGFEKDDSVSHTHLHLLQSVKITSGNHTLNRYYCYSSNINSTHYRNICNKGQRTLPVMEKIVADGTDTLLLHNDYACFGNSDNLQLSARKLLHRGAIVAMQEFLGYDRRGNLLATRINGGAATSYRWAYAEALPVASIVGGHCSPSIPLAELKEKDTLLVTTYTHEPLIGCTAITAPNKRRRTYEYAGNRLAAVKGNKGQTVESYEYSMKAANGQNNMTGKKVYTAAKRAAYLETKTFYDGMGWPVNTVMSGVATQGRDLVTLTAYDALDRKTAEWLPHPVMPLTGLMKESEAASSAQGFYGDSRPVQRFVYEHSPQESPVETVPPGETFADHPLMRQQMGSSTATALLACRRFRLLDSYSFADGGLYGDGELTVTKTTDGDGRTAYVFTDFRGRKILERSMTADMGAADTYYLYDPLGNLCFVLPPGLRGMEDDGNGPWDIRSDGPLRSMAYFYRYDDRLLCVEKKRPGAGAVSFLHDRTGKAVMSQDGNLRKNGKWRFAIPDRFGRPALEGLCTRPDPALLAATWLHADMPATATAAGSFCQTGYKVNIPLAGATILSAKYYDDYRFLNMAPFAAITTGSGSNARGLLTGTATAVIPSGKAILSATWYDDEDRVSMEETTNLQGGSDRVTTTYSFTGKPTRVDILHRTPATGDEPIKLSVACTYDAADRMKTASCAIAGRGHVTIANNEYDDLGRLVRNRRNGTAALETHYAYNLRGWLTQVHSTRFTEDLFYEQTHGGSRPQYSGNIAAMDWKVGGRPDEAMTRGYVFTYDGLGRLTRADYRENGAASNHYDTRYEYDLMGNILSLHRNGLHDGHTFGEIDNLTLAYDGNRLIRAEDQAEDPTYKDCFTFRDKSEEDIEYEYDENGNLTKDLNREICNIQYNCLNLPQRVEFLDGSQVNYTYDAEGKKLRTDYYINPMTAAVPQTGGRMAAAGEAGMRHTRTDYCGNFIYENDTLRQTLFDGGYISYAYPQGTGAATTGIAQPTPSYHFYVQDHLGNNRLVVKTNGTVEQVNHYYPFGGLIGESRNIASTQRYKYNGKELDRMHGLDWYDYGARQYDATIGRWMGMDPMAERYNDASPYGYCFNNPIKLIDPDGREPGDFFRTINDAAIDFGIFYNDNSIRENKEYGSSIFMVTDREGNIGYSYTIANIGNHNSVKVSNPGLSYKIVADIHTHGAYSENHWNNEFSGLRIGPYDKLISTNNQRMKVDQDDIGDSNKIKLTSFLVTPNGSLQKYDPTNGKIQVISIKMPSDKKDPNRLNHIGEKENTNFSYKNKLDIYRKIMFHEFKEK